MAGGKGEIGFYSRTQWSDFTRAYERWAEACVSPPWNRGSAMEPNANFVLTFRYRPNFRGIGTEHSSSHFQCLLRGHGTPRFISTGHDLRDPEKHLLAE